MPLGIVLIIVAAVSACTMGTLMSRPDPPRRPTITKPAPSTIASAPRAG
jgi:hypothetical protein